VPGWPRGHAFLKLGGPVRFECRHELRWERDRAPALGGFQLGEVEPATGSLWAGPGVPDAATRAVVAVAVFSDRARSPSPSRAIVQFAALRGGPMGRC
jgi:hypothetical protein